MKPKDKKSASKKKRFTKKKKLAKIKTKIDTLRYLSTKIKVPRVKGVKTKGIMKIDRERSYTLDKIKNYRKHRTTIY